MSCERYSLAAGVVAWLSRSVRLCRWIAPRADLISKDELGSKGKRSDALFVHGEIEPAKLQGRSMSRSMATTVKTKGDQLVWLIRHGGQSK